eukprot:43251-Chlamydomonas_euryale.AAC.7
MCMRPVVATGDGWKPSCAARAQAALSGGMLAAISPKIPVAAAACVLAAAAPALRLPRLAAAAASISRMACRMARGSVSPRSNRASSSDNPSSCGCGGRAAMGDHSKWPTQQPASGQGKGGSFSGAASGSEAGAIGRCQRLCPTRAPRVNAAVASSAHAPRLEVLLRRRGTTSQQASPLFLPAAVAPPRLAAAATAAAVAPAAAAVDADGAAYAAADGAAALPLLLTVPPRRAGIDGCCKPLRDAQLRATDRPATAHCLAARHKTTRNGANTRHTATLAPAAVPAAPFLAMMEMRVVRYRPACHTCTSHHGPNSPASQADGSRPAETAFLRRAHTEGRQCRARILRPVAVP